MAVQLNQVSALLQREFVFQGLSPEQVSWIAAFFKPITLERETVVFEQGASGDYFYFVFEGKVRVVVDDGGQERLVDILGPGDFFGEEALLFNVTRPTTAVTIQKTTLLQLDPERLGRIFDAFPSIREDVLSTANSRRLARAKNFSWVGPEEVVYFICRKHEFFLFRSLIPSVLLGVGAIPVLTFVLAGVGSPFFATAAEVLGILMLAGALLWGIWSWMDWGNDYYVVTNQRVIWSEKIIGLYESRREAPLDTILAVNVQSSQLGRILGYGNIGVRTFTGGFLMRNASLPNRFASYVRGFKERAKEVSKEEQAKEMQQALEQALTKSMLAVEPEPPAVPMEEPPPVPPPPPIEEEKPVSLRQRWENFLKVRYEEGGVITYRKHWFTLLTKIWLPSLVMLVILFGLVASIWSGYLSPLATTSSLMILFIFAVMLFAAFLWLAYKYLDWSNDIYQLTPDQILDIERKPLGREEKKTAPLESILSIEHERSNLLGVLLNFGPVTINVGETRFVFRNVFNPDQVHQDIADYREALNQRKRDEEAERERKRMVNWLVTFHDQTERLEDFENYQGPQGF
jgi:uncharacterized membrane protein YdbT with pleckstrin-like domain